MSERETRAKLRRLCAALDRRSARAHPLAVAGVVAPLVLGAGLAVAGCSDDESTEGAGGAGAHATSTGTATGTSTGTATGTSTGSGWGGAMPTYGVGGNWTGGYGGTGGEGGATGGDGGGSAGGAGGA